MLLTIIHLILLCAGAGASWLSPSRQIARRSPSSEAPEIHVSTAVDIIPSHAYVQVETSAKGKFWPWRVFKSSPFTPPNMTITGNGGALADGFIFITPETVQQQGAAKENGAFIMTSANEMVYGLKAPGATDFRVQTYEGADYITYWNGFNTEGANTGHGYGQVSFVNSTYGNFTLDPNLDLTKLVQTKVANWSIDIHEHQLTAQNTIMVTAYNNTPYDLTAYGGPADGWIADSLVYELDIATGAVLFEWTASDHVSLNMSHQPVITSTSKANKASPWDWFHINSIEKVGTDYLINSRYCWSTFFVSGTNGNVIWYIEGETGGDFGTLPANGTFRWQHFARASNVTSTSLDLSLFDNHNAGINNGTGPTKGLVYHLELPASKSYTPQLTRRILTLSDELYVESQGNYVPTLSNGNQFLGYGQIAIAREYGPATDGSDLRWQAQFGGIYDVESYRAFKCVWNATPAAWNPNLVVENGYAYVSWNGATDVTDWNVYTTSGETVAKAQTVKHGFETVFKVPSGMTLQVGAVQNGTEVRRSNIVKLK